MFCNSEMEDRWNTGRSIKWDEQNILGRGCEGTVVFAGHFADQPVAVKRILLTNVQLVERERKALVDCSHPRILKLLHVEEEPPFLRLALELCVATLEDYCKGNYKGQMPKEMEALKQMLEGLAYIHSRKYVHRDVKPNNILISSSGELKIADFGFCKPVKGADSFSMSAPCIGTLGWMAPELLKSMQSAESGGKANLYATTAIDVFPLGCVFFFFLTKGTHPFGIAAMRNANILTGRYSLKELGKKPPFLRGIIKEMISIHPKNRPKLDEILTRPVFNTVIPSSSDELLKDDTKFAIWLRNIKSQFASSERKSRKIQACQAEMTHDVCDSSARPTPFSTATINRPSTLQVQTGLQVVKEEPSPTSPNGLKMSTRRRRAETSSDAIKQRLQVSSAPASWQRTLPRSRPGRLIWSEFLSDSAEELEFSSIYIPRIRSVASLSNLEPGLASSTDNFSDMSLASSSALSKSSSNRSFNGDPLDKSE